MSPAQATEAAGGGRARAGLLAGAARPTEPTAGKGITVPTGQVTQQIGMGDGEQDLREINSLFRTPPPPLLHEPGLRLQHQRHTYDMAAVRRSARLAKKPLIPATEKAQRNLWRKLGLTNDEMEPIDEILRDFLSMFQGPLLENIVAALTAIFGLDDEGADMLGEALLNHADTAAAELQQVNGDSTA